MIKKRAENVIGLSSRSQKVIRAMSNEAVLLPVAPVPQVQEKVSKPADVLFVSKNAKARGTKL
jgi:hypothetical protein